jgi:hypothetical protein
MHSATATPSSFSQLLRPFAGYIPTTGGGWLYFFGMQYRPKKAAALRLKPPSLNVSQLAWRLANRPGGYGCLPALASAENHPEGS